MKIFGTVVVCDSEYETSGGEFNLVNGDMPEVLCMVAHVLNENLEHVRTHKLWRGEFGPKPPFDIGPNSLFVAYSAWAEMQCFIKLGWKFPKYIFDQHTAYLAATNFLLPYNPNEKRNRPRKGLSAACRRYGIQGWERIDKEAIAKAIGEGRWREYGQDYVYKYCEEDVVKSVQLLRCQLRRNNWLPPADTDLVIHWSNYSAKAVAQIQMRGMPIDMALWNLVQENKSVVIRELIRQLDPSQNSPFPIYSPDGEWSYDRLEQWLAYIGEPWPRLESGKLDTEGDAFRLMYHIPGVEGLHALRDSLRVVVGANLPIGRDGRNRPSLFPFGTATGRNAHCRSLFNAHAGMRSFMTFPQDRIGLYLDWRTQEVGVGAAHSEDQALIDAYLGGDVYHAFALRSGLTKDPDRKRWAKTEQAMRQRMKSLQLAVIYGMGVPSLARGLDRHPLIASYLIEMYRRLYPRFWQWRDELVEYTMLKREIKSEFGWPMYLTVSPNKRTIFNFPCQSGGAEMLRLAAWRLCEAGIIPNMLVHDGILFELDDKEQIAHAVEIMKGASRDVCRGLEIGVDGSDDKDLLLNGAHYVDKRPMAKKMWGTIMQTLETIGALPKRKAS
jgi:DNA polymerase family A